jgi:hypothetical protein
MVCVQTVGGCASREETAQWKSWEYDQSQVRSSAQQVDAQQTFQRDPSSLTAAARGAPAEVLGLNMTESERRAFQERCAEEMRERARQQARAAEVASRQNDEARRRPNAGRAGL